MPLLLKADDAVKRVSGGLLLANPNHDREGKFTEKYRGVPKRITTRWLKANLPNLDPDEIAEVRSRLSSVNSAARLAIVDQEEQRRMPKLNVPQGFMDSTNVNEFAKTINSLMEEMFGWKSGWNGTVTVQDMWAPGAKDLDCTVIMSPETFLIHSHAMDVLVHELTHGYSMKNIKPEEQNLAVEAYTVATAWEEGFVQGMHPYFRRRVMDELRDSIEDEELRASVFPHDEMFQRADVMNGYRIYVDEMRTIAEALDEPWERYAMAMLSVPVHRRPKFMYEIGMQKLRDNAIDRNQFSVIEHAYDDYLTRLEVQRGLR